MNATAYIKFTILLAVMILTVQTAAWGQTVYYVKETPGLNNPTNNPGIANQGWDYACSDLQKVIDEAYANSADVWVAEGKYIPNSITNNDGTAVTIIDARDYAFVMRPDVKIYGGFPDTGNPSLVERDWKTYETILSGDIGDDGVVINNCYHIVIASSNGINNAVIDGFVITDAHSLGLNLGTSSIMLNNFAGVRRRSGAIYIDKSSLAMNNLDIRENYLEGYGGAICMENNSTTQITQTIKLTNSMVRGNRADMQGGGLYFSNTVIEITNVLISGNTSGTGGAITLAANAFPTLTNVTIAGNYAGTSGGIHGSSANTILRNTIVWGNTTSTSMSIGHGMQYGAVFNNCLIQGNPELLGLSSNNIMNLMIREDFIFNGLIYTSAQNPTINGDYTLKRISPAINTGHNDHVTSTFDLAGNTRIYSATVDIGAYEHQADSGNFYVKEGGDGSFQGTSWSDASDDLQLMIDMASVRGDTVFVAEGSYVPTELRNNDGSVAILDNNTAISTNDHAFVLRPDVKVIGGFPANAADGDGMDTRNWLSNKTVLDGGGGLHHVVLSVGDIGNATIDGFVITGGNAMGSTSVRLNNQNVVRHNGAGIYVFLSSPTLNNLDIHDNEAQGYGGGVCIEFSSSIAKLTNSIIKNNTAAAGGGIADLQNHNEVLYTNLVIIRNEATGIDGGGGLYTTSSSLKLTNATLADNLAPSGSGSGIHVVSGSAVVLNTIVWRNDTDGAISFDHCIVSDVNLSNFGDNLDGTQYTTGQIFVDADALIGDYSLRMGSPCVNAGYNAYNFMAKDVVDKDRIQNGIIDMGAYESPYNVMMISIVTNNYAPVTGGTTIIINGSGFLMGLNPAAVTVTICGIPAEVIVASVTDSEIICTTGQSLESLLGSIVIYNGVSSREFINAFTYYPVNFIKNGNWSEAYNWETQTDDRILPYPDAAVHIMANCLQDIDVAVDSVTVHPLKAYTLTKKLNANVFTLTDNASFINTGTPLSDTIQQNVVHTLEMGRNWYISSPVQTTTIGDALATGVLGGDLINRADVDLSSISVSSSWRVEQYNESIHGWERLPNGSSSLDVGRGYTVNSDTEDIAARFSGTYNDGNVLPVSVSLTRNAGDEKNGFNLVGNPFPSYWRWTEASAASANVYSTIWYRTKVAGDYEFWSYNAAGNVAVAPGWNNGTLTGYYSLAYIPPVQAFWVRLKDGVSSGTIDFDNDLRSHADHTSNILKSAVVEETSEYGEQQMIRMVVSGNQNIDEALIYVHDKAQDNFDDYDSDKWFTGRGVEIFTLPIAENRELVINGLSGISDNMEVPIGFRSDEGGSFSFSAKEIQNLDNFDVFLRDKWQNLEFNLRTDGIYNFTSAQAVNTERFSIRFGRLDDQTDNNGLIAYSDVEKNIVAIYNGDDTEVVKVYDVAGRVIAVQNIAPKTPTIIEGNIKKGVYILCVRNYSIKVVVK